MDKKIRKIINLFSLLLFPITLNFFSPYLAINGAVNGVICGSVLLFTFMFITGLFFKRAWCSWVCPMAALSDFCMEINNNRVDIKKFRIIRYIIFILWIVFLITAFFVNGIKTINPLYLTDNGISVNMPNRYVIYYGILLLFILVNILIGKRGSCHSFCWMSPFLVGGAKLGKILRIPQLQVKFNSSTCVECGLCSKKCPMSIDISSCSELGYIDSQDCILCGECINFCKKNIFSYILVDNSTKLKGVD